MASLGRIIAKDRCEPDEPPVMVLYRVCVRVDLHDTIHCSFQIIHIEAKSINIWLRYDPKHLVSTQTWGDIPLWVISQPKVDGFCSNMGHFKG